MCCEQAMIGQSPGRNKPSTSSAFLILLWTHKARSRAEQQRETRAGKRVAATRRDEMGQSEAIGGNARPASPTPACRLSDRALFSLLRVREADVSCICEFAQIRHKWYSRRCNDCAGTAFDCSVQAACAWLGGNK